MFRFNDRLEERKKRDKELMEEVKLGKKLNFKELISLMISQYIIILPWAFLCIFIFLIVAQGIIYFWSR
ncbi:hypothetical protein [Clostridium tarantellae]|uniref:Uncharacterized protein n=1 Tax=Clostridium tarantellae TaxID=39493 RepID=A0A6I1MLR5_9CLOT|nr:hypothetical protein [Clostridium tarantellae]MPQ43368.1 hypothetical protein [Clostridium tarantellae]